MIRCSNCQKGAMKQGRTKDHDIGPLFGLESAIVESAPALVCTRCGHVMLEGEVVEAARIALATLIVRSCAVLTASEVRFLRETMGLTQIELAERLHIIRGTVTRWESGHELGPVQSFALRTLAAWALGGQALAHDVGAPDAPRPSLRPATPYRIERLNAA